MKPLLLFVFLLLSLHNTWASKEDKVLKEGYLLYFSEKASWNGTDIFLKRFPDKRNHIGGYFSYSEDSVHNCIFFDKQKTPHLLAKISFNDDFDFNSAVVDTIDRTLNDLEMDLFTIRKNALIEISQDTLFKSYNNTSFNLIPLITKKSKKVFVLTGPSVSGVVIFGNDYLLTFDKNNSLKSKKALHKNIIPIYYNDKTTNAVAMHSHLKSTGDLITSTDICTILLYDKYAQWKQHIVLSNSKVSIWDSEKKEFFFMKRKAWDKIQSQ